MKTKEEYLKELQQIAKNRGGNCLSIDYINSTTKLEWQCEEGHIWKAKPADIKTSKTWCPYCAGRHQTIEDMQKIAKERRGSCLSEQYINAKTKLQWQCSEGHTWNATPNSTKNGQWCPACARKRSGNSQRLTIEEMQKIAKERRGRCLSTEYVNTHTKLQWQCDTGHIWTATPNTIKNGHWCPYCAGSAKLTIEEMQKIAEERGGWCLSSNYINNSTHIWWQCGTGHIWMAKPGSIKHGTWCPYCAGRHQTIEDMQQIARERGGCCLSERYILAKTRLKWQCSEGHIWNAIPQDIKSGTWCPYCAGRHQTIEDMQQIARERGGRCLSERYITSMTKLKWQCSEGHTWMAMPNKIKHGRWCPRCYRGRGERLCRLYFEMIFNKDFPPTKIDWLVNEQGNMLELDGYNDELLLAFEYQGEQHFKPMRFNGGENDFEKQKKHDEIKKATCEQKNISLICVPYTIKFDDMPFYICLLYTSPSPRDQRGSRMPSSA